MSTTTTVTILKVIASIKYSPSLGFSVPFSSWYNLKMPALKKKLRIGKEEKTKLKTISLRMKAGILVLLNI